MSKRTLDSKIRKSQSFAKLNYRQRDLWQGIIAVVDDQGRMPGDARFIRSMVWPYDDISIAEVESDLQQLSEQGMVYRYSNSGDLYIQIINWWKYQSMNWAGPSGFPAPDGWTDRLRYHGKENKIISSNWETQGGFISTPPLEKQDSEPPDELYSGLYSEQDSKQDRELSTTLPSRDVNDDVNVDDEVKAKTPAAIATESSTKNDWKPQNIVDLEKLEEIFANARGCPLPDWKKNPKAANKRWRVPLREIYDLCLQDVARSGEYVREVTLKMQRDGLTFDAPDQILKSARSAIFDNHAPPTELDIADQLKQKGFTHVQHDSGRTVI